MYNTGQYLTDDVYRGSELEQDPLWEWERNAMSTARNTGFHEVKLLREDISSVKTHQHG